MVMSTAHALKIVNMETRLKIKPSKNAIFKVTLHILSSYVDEGVIIFVLKLKMVSRDSYLLETAMIISGIPVATASS